MTAFVTACRQARAAATFYTVSWLAFVVMWVALGLGGRFFAAVLDAEQRQSAFALLIVLTMLTVALPFLADAVQAAALLRFARGLRPGASPSPLFVFLLALFTPLLATGIAVGAARQALAGMERAPVLPSTLLTTWAVVAAWLGLSTPAVLLSVKLLPHDDLGGVVAMGVVYGAIGVLRVVLGLRLRAAFGELLSRPAVDDLHAHGTEPVAGG